MIAKAGLGLIGLSAISVGGVALTKPYWLGMADPMPKYTTISSVADYSSTYANDKFGNKNAKYLVSVAESNKDWWDWAFRRMGKKITNSKFSTEGDNPNVKSGYDGNNSLKKVCEDAYKQEDSGFQTAPTSDKFTKEEVWKYCSIGGTQPQTIQEFNTSNSTNQETYSASEAIGGNSSDQKSKLLSIKSTANQWIWDLKDKEFRSTNITDPSYFKTEKDRTGTERKTIKDICKGAYEKKEDSSEGKDKLEKTDVVKYCSLEGK